MAPKGEAGASQQQAAPNTTGTTPVETITPAPAVKGLLGRFEKVTGTGATLPFARCSVQLDGSLIGVELTNFVIWKDAKTGDFTLKMPGQRNFQDLRPAMIEAETKNGKTVAADPHGVEVLSELETGVYAAFMIWNKYGIDKFPGGRVPIPLGQVGA